MLLTTMLRETIIEGPLTLIDADGNSHRFGSANCNREPGVAIRLHDPKLHWSLALNPQLRVGEAYVDGTLTGEQGTIYDFLDLCGRNIQGVRSWAGSRAVTALGHVRRLYQEYNPAGRAQRNVAHHYDLSGRLYDLFLDRDKQYSCAYFPTPDMSLEEAQQAKLRHLAAKLLLRPGQRVLDIGSGWGGLALHLAGA